MTPARLCCPCLLLLLLFVLSGRGHAQPSPPVVVVVKAGVRLVAAGYHLKAEHLTEADELAAIHATQALPAHVPPDLELTVAKLWVHPNRRLKDSGPGFEAVLETREPLPQAEQLYLQAALKEGYGKKESEDMRAYLATCSCEDLLLTLKANTGL